MRIPCVLLLVGLAACSGGGGGGGYSGGSGSNAPVNTNNPPANNPPANNPPASTLTVPAVFPADNAWNTDISAFPVHANSTNFITSIGLNTGLHPDFGTTYQGAPNGIPFLLVSGTQPVVPINFTAYGSESDPGPYPAPLTAPIEGGPSSNGDRHVLVIDVDHKKLYEMGRAFPNANTGGWDCDVGAVFDLTSNNLRPLYWTSADAAGLPIFPGLVRYDEAVTAGAINHALRFTVQVSQKGFVQPARHWASSNTSANVPPMGLRVRLKASTPISTYPAEVQAILTCLKKYGMMVADNGSNWYISGAPDPRWSDANLATISAIKGSDFEVVDTGPITTN